MMQNEHFTLDSIQDYTPPAYPTRDSLDSAKLRKIPKRWAKNAAMIACVGALSLGALTGCAAPTQPPERCGDGRHGVVAIYSQSREFDVEIRAHFGGSGAGPFYVAYLTEQEALGIIRNRLCEAGICFDAPVPNHEATVRITDRDLTATARLTLFDERTRQGLVFPATWWHEMVYWPMRHGEIQDALQQDFAQRHNISATFMQNPGRSMCDGDWHEREWEVTLTFTEEEKQEAGQILKARLESQLDTFIEQLRVEGVLP